MGLDIAIMQETKSWRVGSYSTFNLFRKRIAEIIGFNLDDMKGFGGTKEWGDQPFKELLNHSDCDGELNQGDCEDLKEDFKKWDRRIIQALERDGDSSSLWIWNQFKESIKEVSENGGIIYFC